MNQITAEELQNLCESIKEGDYLTLDGSYEDMISKILPPSENQLNQKLTMLTDSIQSLTVLGEKKK